MVTYRHVKKKEKKWKENNVVLTNCDNWPDNLDCWTKLCLPMFNIRDILALLQYRVYNVYVPYRPQLFSNYCKLNILF